MTIRCQEKSGGMSFSAASQQSQASSRQLGTFQEEAETFGSSQVQKSSFQQSSSMQSSKQSSSFQSSSNQMSSSQHASSMSMSSSKTMSSVTSSQNVSSSFQSGLSQVCIFIQSITHRPCHVQHAIPLTLTLYKWHLKIRLHLAPPVFKIRNSKVLRRKHFPKLFESYMYVIIVNDIYSASAIKSAVELLNISGMVQRPAIINWLF